MTNERTEVLQRILNLRELAESSASENEAMNAMKIAEKMMTSYRVEEAEIALAEGMGEITVEVVDQTSERGFLSVGRNRHKVLASIWDIQTYCEVKTTTRSHLGTYRVIGDRPDVELFHWMVRLVRDALDREYASWKRRQPTVGRGAKGSFQLAMAERINRRLQDMARERCDVRNDAKREAALALGMSEADVNIAVSNGDLAALNSSNALVVVAIAEQKRQAVSSAYNAAYSNVRMGTASGFGYGSNGSAASAGRSAGNRVGLGRPVGGSATARLS